MDRQIVGSVAWSALATWIARAISFGVVAVLARLLLPSDFGLVAIASVFVGFAVALGELGFGPALIQRAELRSEHLTAVFWISLAVAILLASALALFAPIAARVYDEPALEQVLRWLALTPILSSLSVVQVALLKRELEFRKLSLRGLLTAFAGGATGVALAATGAGVWSLVGQQVVGAATGAAALWMLSDWRPSTRFSLTAAKDIVRFGMSVTGVTLANFAMRRGDDFLIGAVLGPVSLGYYTIAYRILLLFTELIMGVVNTVALPVFSRLQGDIAGMRDALATAMRFTGTLAFPMFAGLALLADRLVPLVYGGQWSPSIPILQVLAFAGALQSILYYNGTVLTASGLPGVTLKLTVSSALVNLVAFVATVRQGILAVAIGYTLATYVSAPLWLRPVNRTLATSNRVLLTGLTAPLAATLVMSGVVAIASFFLVEFRSGTLEVVALAAIGAAVYIGILTAAHQPNWADLQARLGASGRRST